ncbi:MAG: hypothetical protein K0R19_597 [Bacillota bacterium]|jgi:hypothetical protein|nr:hypothetical protein [Bacillota bacterium]
MSGNRIETDVNFMTELYEIIGLFPNATSEGFSASKSSLAVSANAQITGFSVSNPYFSSSSFNSATGNYTVPETGIYQIQAIINYNTNAAITATLGADVNPTIEIRRTSAPAATLIIGQLPIVNLNLNLGLVTLTIRAVLGGGSINLSGLINLNDGDILGLYYNADGMTVALTLIDMEWFIYRIS